MKLPKTNVAKFAIWFSLGLVGFLICYLVVTPMMYDWPISYKFSDDWIYGLYKLFVAEILLLPAVIAVIWSLISSIKTKQLAWALVHTLGLLALAYAALYFSDSILSPGRGL